MSFATLGVRTKDGRADINVNIRINKAKGPFFPDKTDVEIDGEFKK
jgi:hypothetical protein